MQADFLRQHLTIKLQRFVATPLGATVAWAIVSLVLLYFSISLKQALDLSPGWWLGLCGGIGLVAALCMWKALQPPSFKRDELGVLLAIRAEDPSQYLRIRNDLVPLVKRALENTNSAIRLLSLRDFHAEEVTDNESAAAYMAKTRATLIWFGSVAVREHKGEEHLVLRSEGMAVHSPTTQENSSLLSVEMASVLPLNRRFKKKDELDGFELTSELFGLGAIYIASVIAYISNETAASIKLLEDLKTKIESQPRKAIKSIHTFKNLDTVSCKRLKEFAANYGSNCLTNWQSDQKIEHIKELEQFIETSQFKWQDDPTMLQLRAVCHFLLNRNTQAAHGVQDKIRKLVANPPAAWYYSKAFLLAYDRNYREALKLYRKAFSIEAPRETPVQIEDFINLVLREEPNKVGLLFFLGLINLHSKNDLTSSKRDLAEFLSRSSEDDEDLLREEAQKLLAELEKTQQEEGTMHVLDEANAQLKRHQGHPLTIPERQG